ncbi:MAG: hypothetical protein K8F93_01740 [Burkholderiales bacterium]|nr:hypothetical protein [Burkholderiales bacterium]
MATRAAIALFLLLGAGAAAAQQRPGLPVDWEAPPELRVLFEQHLPAPPAEAGEDRGAPRASSGEAPRRSPRPRAGSPRKWK